MVKKTEIKRGDKCPTCHRYYDRHVSVDGLIVKNKEILLILRNAGQETGKWALVGGKVDWDETVEEALHREVKEEIGTSVNIKRLLGVYSDPTRDPDNTQTVAIAFVAEAEDESFRLNEEVKDIRWYQPEELPENIAFDHRKIINDYVQTLSS